MAAISGKDGDVQSGGTDIAHITAWSFNPTSNNPDWASSDTSGYKNRVGGVKDGSGSFDFKFDAADIIFSTLDVGSSVTLTLKINATYSFTVPALIDGITFDVDVNDGDVVGGSCDFSTNGQWTNPS